MVTGCRSTDARLWELTSATEIRRFDTNRNQDDRIACRPVAFSPGGKKLLTGGVKGPLLWDVATGKPEQTLRGYREAVQCVAFSPDGQHVLTGSWDDTKQDHHLGRLTILSGVREYPIRVKCATLAWHALDAALSGQSDEVTTE